MMIGVVALQGGSEPHLRLLARLGLAARPVREATDLAAVAGLVLPGGESTTQSRLIKRFGLGPALDAFVAAGRPLLATCAGLIVAVDRGYLNADLKRNGYGRQVHSFEARDDLGTLRMRFIRAPRIGATGPGVTVLARLRGEPIVLRQGNLIATNGHPELTGDATLHRALFAPER